MNAAARAINQSNLFNGHLLSMRCSRSVSIILLLLVAILTTALLVVYNINEYRTTFNQLQQLKSKHHHLKLHKGQLLLEKASLATPARIEQLAVDKLQMQLPKDNQIYLLRLP